MQFSARQDIEAPIEIVFENMTTFEVYERAAMRRGAEVRRNDTLTSPGAGAQWDVRFMLRGKERDLMLEVLSCVPPTDLVVSLNSKNITGSVRCDLFALSKTRTRLTVITEIRPLTLPARLLIQSLKLTKSTLTQKYKTRIADFAAEIEARQADTA
ncbi:MAG: SRPBCC family protein [Roseobacter sp.]